MKSKLETYAQIFKRHKDRLAALRRLQDGVAAKKQELSRYNKEFADDQFKAEQGRAVREGYRIASEAEEDARNNVDASEWDRNRMIDSARFYPRPLSGVVSDFRDAEFANFSVYSLTKDELTAANTEEFKKRVEHAAKIGDLPTLKTARIVAGLRGSEELRNAVGVASGVVDIPGRNEALEMIQGIHDLNLDIQSAFDGLQGKRDIRRELHETMAKHGSNR